MRMRRNHVLAALPLVRLALVLVFFVRRPALDVQTLLSADPGQGPCSPVTVVHPPDGALFPPDIAPPTFHWSAEGLTCDTWAIRLRFQDDQNDIDILVREPRWVPDRPLWETIKRRTLEEPAEMIVVGVNRSGPTGILARGRVSFATSSDEVGAPLFYREVNLPFVEAVGWRPPRVASAGGPASAQGVAQRPCEEPPEPREVEAIGDGFGHRAVGVGGDLASIVAERAHGLGERAVCFGVFVEHIGAWL